MVFGGSTGRAPRCDEGGEQYDAYEAGARQLCVTRRSDDAAVQTLQAHEGRSATPSLATANVAKLMAAESTLHGTWHVMRGIVIEPARPRSAHGMR